MAEDSNLEERSALCRRRERASLSPIYSRRSNRMEFSSIDVNPFGTVVQMIALNCLIEVTLLKEETAFDEDRLVSASLRQLERH
ncbi:hypothetical protein CEXT_186071 [Caerostris extrusa]|uniref:Uncharacterized protein n=1 Tax=Caerostris extrusa TaxID=172846 RepID=A0AAV4TVL9_CAEEX|nr:hypothetical protein CEXT_186071 [Caerostris extrusa]